MKTRSIVTAWALVGLVLALLGGAPDAVADGFVLLAPHVEFECPANLSNVAPQIVPPTFVARFSAVDPDGPDGLPVRYRMLYKEAVDAQGLPVRTAAEYAAHAAELIRWDDPLWSDWLDYPADGQGVQVEFPQQQVDSYFLLAVQVMDVDGAVSLGRRYQQDVLHVVVRENVYSPALVVQEPFLGVVAAPEWHTEIAPGQPLNFSWVASAEVYCAAITSYRHGWDLIDANDPYDPGWAGPPGVAPENLRAAERTFQDGLHSLTVRVTDSAGQVRLARWYLHVIPYVDRANQLPLLIIDQVVDDNVNNWQDPDGVPLNDEVYRNAYWEFLADVSGGVADLDRDRDWRDHRQAVRYSDLVRYQAVLCFAAANDQQTMFNQFRAVDDKDRYVWLSPYQAGGGNLFLVGQSSMDSFVERKPNYATPMVFDTTETAYFLDGNPYIAGFGTTVMPDGSEVLRGPNMYPYATAGIAALDWTSAGDRYIYGRSQTMRFDRRPECAGLMGLVLDADFGGHHAVAPGALADTIFTDPSIDWRSLLGVETGDLGLGTAVFPFTTDEFVDANLSQRTTPFAAQECSGGDYPTDIPGGLCVEPMFRGVSRFDWMRQERWARGDQDWPDSRYTQQELADGCGPLALAAYGDLPQGSAVTNGQVFGYLSYKMVPNKPVARADVYWGFDPYRFDHAGTKQAVRWVLDYFGLVLNP